MKKKLITTLLTLTTLFIFYFNTTTTVTAANCPPHKNYNDYVTATSPIWNTYHDYVSGYKYNPDGKLVPIYSSCTISNQIAVHGLFCGECYAKVGSYDEQLQYHGKCGK